MSEEENIPESPKEEVNENILPIGQAGSKKQAIEQSQTTNSKLQTSNMEVHHHPTCITGEKNSENIFLKA